MCSGNTQTTTACRARSLTCCTCCNGPQCHNTALPAAPPSLPMHCRWLVQCRLQYRLRPAGSDPAWQALCAGSARRCPPPAASAPAVAPTARSGGARARPRNRTAFKSRVGWWWLGNQDGYAVVQSSGGTPHSEVPAGVPPQTHAILYTPPAFPPRQPPAHLHKGLNAPAAHRLAAEPRPPSQYHLCHHDDSQPTAPAETAQCARAPAAHRSAAAVRCASPPPAALPRRPATSAGG